MLMKLENIIKYLKRMSLSLVMMLLIAAGMADLHPLLQPLYIVIGVLILQFGYQMFKSARSRGVIDANIREAARVKRGVILFEATESDVSNAKSNSGGGMSMGGTMIIALLAPLAIFMGSGFLLSQVPGVLPWQSYLIGALLSMPVSIILTSKMGAAPGEVVATPKSFIVSEKGIAFDHLNQYFIMRFPLIKLKVQKEKNLIETEAKSEASTIPNKLKLFSGKIGKLNKILAKNMIDQERSK